MSSAALDMPTSIIEIIAFHEAGHAVVALKLGIGLRSVGIRPDQGNGYCRDKLRNRILNGETMSDGDWTWARQKAFILLSGDAAERVYNLEQCDLPFCLQDDEIELNELCCSAFGDLGPKASRWIKECRDETDRIVEANWKGICSLAELLLLNNHLSGQEAERAIRDRHSIDWR